MKGPPLNTITYKEQHPLRLFFFWRILLNHFSIYKYNNKMGFSYQGLKVGESHSVLEKNENTCVPRLTENRNFISVHVQSHFTDTVLLSLEFLGGQKWESKWQVFPVTFGLNLHGIKILMLWYNIFLFLFFFLVLETLAVSDTHAKASLLL